MHVRSTTAFSVLTTLLLSTQALAVCGDVSGDRKVTTADALAVLRLAVGQDPNVNCDECASTCFGDIRFLLGEWSFQSEFDEVLFEDNYDLFAVDEPDCLIAGEDLNDAGIVIAFEASESGYDYALLDPSEEYCDFFVFDRTGPDMVDGFDILLDVTEDGSCGDPISGLEHPMYGDRVTSAMATARPTSAAAVDPSQRTKAQIQAERTAAPVALKPEIAALLERMRSLAASRKAR